MATGAGKSLVMLDLLAELGPGKRACVMVPKLDLMGADGATSGENPPVQNLPGGHQLPSGFGGRHLRVRPQLRLAAAECDTGFAAAG